MRKAAALFTFVAVLIISSASGALATPIVTNTTDWQWAACTDINTCSGANATEAVSPKPGPWHNPIPDPIPGTWISSHASDFSSIVGGTIQDFFTTIDFGSGKTLTFKVWADDSAQVFLDSTALSGPPITTAGTNCASAVISCTDALFGQFSTGTLTDSHVLHVRVLQLQDFGGSPFGALVEGDLSAVPEPATILLLGSALAAAGVVSRRRSGKSAS